MKELDDSEKSSAKVASGDEDAVLVETPGTKGGGKKKGKK